MQGVEPGDEAEKEGEEGEEGEEEEEEEEENELVVLDPSHVCMSVVTCM